MIQALNELIATLEQTHTLYGNLLQVVETERQLVLQSNIEDLSAVLVDKQNILAQLNILEKRRNAQIQQIADEMNIPSQQFNLSTLAAHVSAPYTDQIQHWRMELGGLVASIGKANEENRSLLRHCLTIVQGGLQFLQHWAAPPSVYGASGKIDGGAGGGRLLSGTV